MIRLFPREFVLQECRLLLQLRRRRRVQMGEQFGRIGDTPPSTDPQLGGDPVSRPGASSFSRHPAGQRSVR